MNSTVYCFVSTVMEKATNFLIFIAFVRQSVGKYLMILQEFASLLYCRRGIEPQVRSPTGLYSEIEIYSLKSKRKKKIQAQLFPATVKLSTINLGGLGVSPLSKHFVEMLIKS